MIKGWRRKFIRTWAMTGHRLGYDWATTGLRLAIDWATTGLRLAIDWATTGLRLAIDWATTGLRLAIDWATTGLPSREIAISSTKMETSLTDTPRAEALLPLRREGIPSGSEEHTEFITPQADGALSHRCECVCFPISNALWVDALWHIKAC